MTTAPKVAIGKHEGDDTWSWAVFVDGAVVEYLTGLSRSQAGYYRRQILERRAGRLSANPS